MRQLNNSGAIIPPWLTAIADWRPLFEALLRRVGAAYVLDYLQFWCEGWNEQDWITVEKQLGEYFQSMAAGRLPKLPEGTPFLGARLSEVWIAREIDPANAPLVCICHAIALHDQETEFIPGVILAPFTEAACYSMDLVCGAIPFLAWHCQENPFAYREKQSLLTALGILLDRLASNIETSSAARRWIEQVRRVARRPLEGFEAIDDLVVDLGFCTHDYPGSCWLKYLRDFAGRDSGELDINLIADRAVQAIEQRLI